ncbi:putative RNA recognition motif domain, nucleotide-binding alpha-beta plait domain superfamily [Helianthus annuus]|nr:putative RNA recognition motif domain, nucleotide-binding alpha-beta plait domain superfamily [Helianthus annuus]
MYEEKEEGEIRDTSDGFPEGGSFNTGEIKEKAITFYVSNIHPHISDGELWTECWNYGHIVDAYIARKLDKKGQRFGFLRFVKVMDIEKMTKALNHMSFFGWKIKANVARFVKVVKKNDQKQNKIWVKKPERYEQPDSDRPKDYNRSYVKQGMSWADVAKGIKTQQGNENCLSFANESSLYNKWRGKAVLGELKKVELLKKVGIMRKNLGLRDDQVRYMGGLCILIIFDSELSMEEMLASQEDMWKEWFSDIKKWNGEDIPYQRIAWLRIRGIPLQLWIDGVFNCVGERFGKVIKPSDADENDINFNYDAVGVLVNHGATINEKITLRWKNRYYDVWVLEEFQFWAPDLRPITEDTPEPIGSKPKENAVETMDNDQRNQETGNDQRSPESESETQSPVKESPMKVDGGKPTDEDGSSDNVNEVWEQQKLNEGREDVINKEKNKNIEDKAGNDRSAEENMAGQKSISNIVDPVVDINEDSNTVGPDGLKGDTGNGPIRKTQKKRKRTSITESRSGCLKPNHTIAKRKIPDLNVDLSDESRLRTKKRAVGKKDKFSKRRGRAKIRISEEDINNFDQGTRGKC